MKRIVKKKNMIKATPRNKIYLTQAHTTFQKNIFWKSE